MIECTSKLDYKNKDNMYIVYIQYILYTVYAYSICTSTIFMYDKFVHLSDVSLYTVPNTW